GFDGSEKLSGIASTSSERKRASYQTIALVKPLEFPSWSSSARTGYSPDKIDKQSSRLNAQLLCRPTKREAASCITTISYAYVLDSDPYWFASRNCSASCATIKDSIFMLQKGSLDWNVSISGYLESPASEVVSQKNKILKDTAKVYTISQ